MPYSIEQTGSAYYVSWTERGEQLCNGWFNSHADAERWARVNLPLAYVTA
jgi:hypothetical protein